MNLYHVPNSTLHIWSKKYATNIIGSDSLVDKDIEKGGL